MAWLCPNPARVMADSLICNVYPVRNDTNRVSRRVQPHPGALNRLIESRLVEGCTPEVVRSSHRDKTAHRALPVDSGR